MVNFFSYGGDIKYKASKMFCNTTVSVWKNIVFAAEMIKAYKSGNEAWYFGILRLCVDRYKPSIQPCHHRLESLHVTIRP